jgi:tripartite-type tricarboxylate transporter receptor subunit TctC
VLLAAALIAALATQAAPAFAQDYPNRPITLIVPFPPGGSATIIARAIADKLGDALGQQIVIDNRGGAGGSIGARQVAKSAPDGTTILLAFTGTLAVSPMIFPNVGYDPRKDFAAIGLIGMAPSVLAVHPSVAAHSVADLISAAKAAPGKIQFGSPGIGTVNHLAGELFASMADIKITHIPYKGTGPAINDLLGGHIAMMFAPIPRGARQHRGGNAARARRHQLAALAPPARHPDRRRSGLARLRGGAEVGVAGAGGHAARHHRAAQQGAQRRARHRRGETTARGRGRRTDPGPAGSVYGRYRPRGGEMVEARDCDRPQR